MTEVPDRAQLDLRIDELRASAGHAALGSGHEAFLTIELAYALGERYESCLAAGPGDEPSGDLSEAVDRLDDLLTRIEPGHVSFPPAVLAAGLLREGRYWAIGDPGDRDTAIRWLRVLLALDPGDEPLLVGVHKSLGQLAGARYDDEAPVGGQAAELDTVIEHARAGLDLALRLNSPAAASDMSCDGAADQDDPVAAETIAELRVLLGYALEYRFMAAARQMDASDGALLAAVCADRDEGIRQLRLALDSLPGDHPDWPETAAALGRLHHDRYDAPWQEPASARPDSADLGAAADLLLRAAEGGVDDERTLRYLVWALSDRLGLRSDSADRDALIAWTARFLEMADASDPAAVGFRDLLGIALLDRAQDDRATRVADASAGIEQMQAVLATIPAADCDRARVLAALAELYWLRADGDSDLYDDIDAMVGYAGQAWPLLPDDDDSRRWTGLYLSVGLHERLIRPGQAYDPPSVNLGIEVLTVIEPLFADDADLHLMVMITLGHFLVAHGQYEGVAEDLEAAQPWLLRAARALPLDDPQWSEPAQTLAAGMTVLSNPGVSLELLDLTIELLSVVVTRPSGKPDRDALTRGALGQALVLRSTFTSSRNDLDEGIAHVRAAYELALDGDPARVMMAWNLGSALVMRFQQRRDAQDRKAAHYYLGIADAEQDRQNGAPGSALEDAAADGRIAVLAMQGMLALADSMDGGQAALESAVGKLRSAVAILPPGHPREAWLRSDLSLTLVARGAGADGGAGLADFREAAALAQAAAQSMPDGHVMRPLALMRAGAATVAVGMITRDPVMIRTACHQQSQLLDDLDPRFGERMRLLGFLGAAAEQLHEFTGDVDDLDAAVGWLTAACEQVGHRPGHPLHANLLIRLGHVYRKKGDDAAARDTGLAALRVRVRDILLQTGTEHGLGTARAAASEAAQVAAWCLQDRQPRQAIEALELGRGLVLYSATSVAELPELLDAAGHGDLAQDWRHAGPQSVVAPWEASSVATVTMLTEPTLEVPDDLRERTLAVLAGTDAGSKLLAAPDPAQIADALADTGADALVYLLPAREDLSAHAILMPVADAAGGSEPESVALPLLHTSLDGPLTGYAAAQRALLAISAQAGAQAGPAKQRWQDALELLCESAWPAVIGPLIEQVSRWRLNRPVRLVLVPVGELSQVPWHAAFCAPEPASSRRYACAEMVISYAVSGRQLIEVSRRPALALQDDPVVYSDRSLPFALLEAMAIHDCCYPAGRYLGYAPPEAGKAERGSPGQVLAELPAADHAGASMLHFGCHADVAGSAPGRSHLILARGEHLRVEEILRQAGGRSAFAPGGLVTLAACRSDLTAQDYDEALTLSTAFLAAGAVTVVGARWEVPDEDSPLLMFMFHHFMTAGGYSPRDALRLAQLWMLDEGRKPPPDMPEALAKDAGYPGLAELATWAAFTHQGR